MRIQYVICLMLLLLSSCEIDPVTPEPVEETQVVSPLEKYFLSFENEARKRNLIIDLAELDLTAEISEINEDNVAGTCSYSSHFPNHITIDSSFWNNASDIIREMVVFHELGHCVLGQGHREETDVNGNCLSIMQSGTEGCRLLYDDLNRTYYLDEFFLFDM